MTLYIVLTTVITRRLQEGIQNLRHTLDIDPPGQRRPYGFSCVGSRLVTLPTVQSLRRNRHIRTCLKVQCRKVL